MSDVTVFTKPGCPYCAAAKDDLQQRGVEYEEYNVKADKSALKRMLDVNGGRRQVPTILTGDKVAVGFNGY